MWDECVRLLADVAAHGLVAARGLAPILAAPRQHCWLALPRELAAAHCSIPPSPWVSFPPRRRMQHNDLTGTLPASWPTAMPELQILSVHENKLRGPLPRSWAAPGAWARLEELYVQSNQVRGAAAAAALGCWARMLWAACCAWQERPPWRSMLAPAPSARPRPAPLVLRSAPLQLSGDLPANKEIALQLPKLRILDMSCEPEGSPPQPWSRGLPACAHSRSRSRRICTPLLWLPTPLRRSLSGSLSCALVPRAPAVNRFTGPLPPGWGRKDAAPNMELL